MKILIYSPAFYPSVGGLETVVRTLADEFVAAGHEVTVVSQTAATDETKFGFDVIRQPSFGKMLSLLKWSDVYFQANISLRGLWPLLFVSRPLIVSHNNWYQRPNGKRVWQDHLKHLIARRTVGISVSQAVAEHADPHSTVIPNPYRANTFHKLSNASRTRDLVFTGRLVSDKGVDLLLDALALLNSRGITPQLTIIGGGPEEAALKAQAERLSLGKQVEFAGVKRDAALTEMLNAHRILVVPSRWQEPFGIVALEGIACGCVVVGSEGGGLKEAIGSCGVTFPNGDAHALAAKLEELLLDERKIAALRAGAESHLAKHQPATVAQRYLDIFERAAGGIAEEIHEMPQNG